MRSSSNPTIERRARFSAQTLYSLHGFTFSLREYENRDLMQPRLLSLTLSLCSTSQAIGFAHDLRKQASNFYKSVLLQPAMQPDRERLSLSSDVFLLALTQMQQTVVACNIAKRTGVYLMCITSRTCANLVMLYFSFHHHSLHD
jgi:hypothetical protein